MNKTRVRSKKRVGSRTGNRVFSFKKCQVKNFQINVRYRYRAPAAATPIRTTAINVNVRVDLAVHCTFLSDMAMSFVRMISLFLMFLLN
jgi:hypothetical protein